jgi:hypothetical protein
VYGGSRWKGRVKMKLSNKTYDILKWVLVIFIPALIVLISKLGGIYHFDTDTIIETIGAFATFFGVILGISTYNYRADKKQDTYNTDGIDMIEVEHEDQNEPTEE